MASNYEKLEACLSSWSANLSRDDEHFRAPSAFTIFTMNYEKKLMELEWLVSYNLPSKKMMCPEGIEHGNESWPKE